MILWRFLIRFFLAMLVGCVVVVWYLHYDTHLLTYLQNTVIHSLETQCGCHCSLRVRSCNIIIPELVLEDVAVSQKADVAQSAWSWHAHKIVARFSWLYFLMHGAIDLRINLYNVAAHSTIDLCGYLSLLDHIKTFFVSKSPVPVIIKEVVLAKSIVIVSEPYTDSVCTTTVSGSMATLPDCFKVVIYSSDGTIKHRDTLVMEHIDATTLVEIPFTRGASSTVRLSGSVDVMPPNKKSETFMFSGVYHTSSGSFSLSNADGSVAIPHLNICNTAQGILIDSVGSVALNHLTPYLPSLFSACTGNVALQAQVMYTKNGFSVDGGMTINNMAYGTYPLGSCTVSCKRDAGQWHGTAELLRNNALLCNGEWCFDESTKTGSCAFANDAPISIFGTRFWAIKPHEGILECSLDGADKHMHGVCRVRATNDKLESSIDCVTHFDLRNNHCIIDGGLGTTNFHGICNAKSAALLETFTCTDESGNALITCKLDSQKSDCLHAEIAFPLIKQLSMYLFGLPLGGQGVMHCVFEKTTKGFDARFSLLDGTIRLLQTHNFIRDVQATVTADMQQGRVQINDFLVQLQKGSVQASSCTFYFDENGQVTFAHLPLIANKLFLNINKDMFVVFSSSLLGTYSATGGSALTGSIIIDRGQVKKNIFSAVAQKSLVSSAGTLAPFPGSDCLVALSVHTKAPLHVKTSVLDAHITGNGTLAGTIGTPQLSGGIDIMHGTLAFPYRSLPIVSGKLFCSPFHGTDPGIELLARGKVKKYQVTLRVDGTVSHPRINFESSPPLTEEQIITLLLSGADDGSLALAMPALVMHNVQNLLFGDEQSSTSHDSFIKNMLKPLKMIRIVPNFSDQQARGGIRGSLIIDLDDRFHALIQKNFSLPEDTRFEVEYHVSDDMTVRAIKDEHSDLGGEVEMRWKF